MKLLLVDGNYYLYRSYFAIRNLTTSAGEPVNAVFGFVKALRRMLRDLRPDFGAVVWDMGLPERRMALQPAYKQQREEMPTDMVPQGAHLRRICPLIGLTGVGIENTEADDLIACYARAATAEAIGTVIATNDKDLLQLADDSVRIYSTAKADLTPENPDFALLGPAEVEAKWGVVPSRISDVLALCGDVSDNIPGVEGVGPKTAAKWIREYGSLEGLLERLDSIPNENQRTKLSAAVDRIRENYEMVSLDYSLALPVPVRGLTVAPRPAELAEELCAFEFRSLLREVEAEATATRSVQGDFFQGF